MDRQRAMEILNGVRICCECDDTVPWCCDECDAAILMAGEALKQPEIVCCKDCKHRPKEPNWKTCESGFDIEFPEGSKCPCQCSGDGYYSWYPEDDWFCANGERR